MTDTLNLTIFIAEMYVFFKCMGILYDRITEPFRIELERFKDLTKVIEECDGCGNIFHHHLHDHYGYRSCSIACDDFLNDLFTEME